MRCNFGNTSSSLSTEIIFTLKDAGDMSDIENSEAIKSFTPFLTLCHQVHGTNAVEIGHGHFNTSYIKNSLTTHQSNMLVIKNCDALVTTEKGIWLGIRTADCAPVVLFSEYERKTAILHVGRKGAVGGIIEKTIFNFFSKPSGISCAIGPHIKKCCYSFEDSNIAAQFGRFYLKSEKKIDLTGYIIDKLTTICGLKSINIFIAYF